MVRFGVAGYPPAFSKSPFRRDRLKILEWLYQLGLNAFELQMTYGPKMKPEMCREYRKMADDFGISLSVHASYFIVFSSDDPVKLKNSSDTLKRTYELCNILGANVAVLHPGSLYGQTSESSSRRFIDNISVCLDEIGKTDIGLFIETAGKVGQLGSVDEVIHISDSVEGIYPCIDFGHVHARTLGTLDNYDAISLIFKKLETHSYLRTPDKVHFHYTPIDYGRRGEITHKAIHDRLPNNSQMALPIMDCCENDSEKQLYYPRFEPISKALKEYRAICTVISETFNSQEEGALALKGSYIGYGNEPLCADI